MKRKVTKEEAQKYAAENSLNYNEVSAKNGDNIHLTFDIITKKLTGKDGAPTERKKDESKIPINLDLKLGDSKKVQKESKGCC